MGDSVYPYLMSPPVGHPHPSCCVHRVILQQPSASEVVTKQSQTRLETSLLRKYLSNVYCNYETLGHNIYAVYKRKPILYVQYPT